MMGLTAEFMDGSFSIEWNDGQYVLGILNNEGILTGSLAVDDDDLLRILGLIGAFRGEAGLDN